MGFIPDKPAHGRFAFRSLNSTQYKTYAQQYSKAKAGEYVVFMVGRVVLG